MVRLLILSQYYYPEEVGIGVQLHQLARDLLVDGHYVTVLTAFPNYPAGAIFEEYKGKVFQREVLDGVEVVRSWIYATPSKSFWPRILNFCSFSVSSLFGGAMTARRPDIIYAILPPLSLGITAVALATAMKAYAVINIQDIMPHAAIATGVLHNSHAIRFFEAMERWIYKHSDHVVVISEGFRQNLLGKRVPSHKISVVPNWADPDFIQPGPKENSLRDELNAPGKFLLIYSGGLTHNSNLEPLVEAAVLLRDEPFTFVIVGDGVRKPGLEALVAEKELTNVQFKPFQPLERYPELLRAADMNLVTLSHQASLVSVPSKIFKQMASGRPVLAITATGNEVERLVTEAQCGLTVPPDNPKRLVEVLRWAATHSDELDRMGINGRRYLEKHHSRDGCVAQIEALFKQIVTRL